MKKSDHQRKLIDACRAKGELKASEAYELLRSNYYCNHQKHIGDILTRMVRAGIFYRVKKGLYKLCIESPYHPKDQTKLF